MRTSRFTAVVALVVPLLSIAAAALVIGGCGSTPIVVYLEIFLGTGCSPNPPGTKLGPVYAMWGGEQARLMVVVNGQYNVTNMTTGVSVAGWPPQEEPIKAMAFAMHKPDVYAVASIEGTGVYFDDRLDHSDGHKAQRVGDAKSYKYIAWSEDASGWWINLSNDGTNVDGQIQAIKKMD